MCYVPSSHVCSLVLSHHIPPCPCSPALFPTPNPPIPIPNQFHALSPPTTDLPTGLPFPHPTISPILPFTNLLPSPPTLSHAPPLKTPHHVPRRSPYPGENHWPPCDWSQCRGDDPRLRCCHPNASHKGRLWRHHWDPPHCVRELHHTGKDQELWGRPPEHRLLRLSTHWLMTPPWAHTAANNWSTLQHRNRLNNGLYQVTNHLDGICHVGASSQKLSPQIALHCTALLPIFTANTESNSSVTITCQHFCSVADTHTHRRHREAASATTTL